MSYEIETVQLDARPYVGVRSVVSREQIADACADSFGRTWGWLAEKGLTPASMPISIYHRVDHVSGQYDIQPSLVVADALQGEGDISAGSLPSGAALTTTHTGPYEGLGDAWAALFAYAESESLAPSASPWEEYIDDPGEVEASSLRTRLFFPVDS